MTLAISVALLALIIALTLSFRARLNEQSRRIDALLTAAAQIFQLVKCQGAQLDELRGKGKP